MAANRHEAIECELGFAPPPYRLDYERQRTDYGIGLLGLHWVVQIMHLPAYRSAGYRLAAAAEPDEAKVAQVRSKGHAIGRYARDFTDVVAMDEVQVLDCCFGHKPGKQERKLAAVEAAAAAGKSILVHKPVASTLAVAERMAQIARQAGVHLAVNQNCRYNPANYTIRQLLEPSRLGPPSVIELQNHWTGPPHPRGDGAAAWIAHTVHHADLIRWWVGAPCTSVFAQAGSRTNLITYTFANGTLASHIEGHSGVELHETTMRLVTERGVIKGGHNWNWHIPSAKGRDFVHVWRDRHGPRIELPLPEHIYEPLWSDINHYLPHEGPYYDLAAPIAGMMGSMGSLMRAVETGQPPDNSIASAIESLRMCLAAEWSARCGRPVDPREVPADATSVAS
jgi:predicted dehydrogenase